MSKIAAVWHSNAPHANTGYGTQTRQVVSRMIRDGHEILVAANYGVEATVMNWDTDGVSIPVFPRGMDTWNNDIVGPYFDDWSRQHPDHHHMQFTLFDVWVYNSPRFDSIPTASWVPIDHAPAPAGVAEFLSKPTVTPIAMSKFGRDMLNAADIDCLYVPHAIDTNLFKPTARVKIGGRMMTGREIMGIGEDRFVVSAVNANKAGAGYHRKSWAENILAFSIFAARHDDAVLYLHTERDGAMGGYKMRELLKACNVPEHQYRFAHQYGLRMGIPQDAMAAIYTASDVGLLATAGEGFGLTSIEMQACSRPVIVSNFSAQPELLGDGWLVEGQPHWDAGQGAWFQTPNIGSIVDALEAAYARGRGMSDKARDFVVENYDADHVYDTMWRPALEVLSA